MKAQYTHGQYGHRVAINGEVLVEKQTMDQLMDALVQKVVDRCARALGDVTNMFPRLGGVNASAVIAECEHAVRNVFEVENDRD